MENYFEQMSYLQDFWCMCWDDKFLNQTDIKNDCNKCPDIVKRSCLALCDILKWNYPNKEQIIQKFIGLTKEHIKDNFNFKNNDHDWK